jgi:hypothetical protein
MNWKLVKFLIGCSFVVISGWCFGVMMEKQDYGWAAFDVAIGIYWFYLTKTAWIEWKTTKEGDK